MTRRALITGLFALLLAPAAAAGPPPTEPGWHQEVQFNRYSPLAAKWAFAERVFAPTIVDRLRRFEQASGVEAVEHTVDLAEEKFDLFIPKRRPAEGYGVIVYVSPGAWWPLSREYRRELDRRGLVWVMGYNAGNRQNAFERRMPLALHGLANVQALLEVDPSRVYIAGFSGGSRVAERMSLWWPDVFHGALLFASSDEIGQRGLSPPAPELMHLFQHRTRVVFATGSSDLPNRKRDVNTKASLEQYCVANVATISIPRNHHWLPNIRGFRKALDAVEAAPSATPDPACLSRLAQEAEQGMARVESLLAAGDVAEAGKLLGALEDRFGGLLGPDAVTLARTIAGKMGPENGAGGG